jgi:nucleoside-diphosphate-sugar epimerase
VPAVEPRNLGPARVLVIGGTGFIGRALTRALVASGRRVRVLSRGRASPFADLGDGVEVMAGSLSDPVSLRAAMEGIACVYHLAKAEESSWEAYLQNDVAVVERVAEAALAAGVARFVYTGTIASYDASDAGQPITETTPFGPMENRNLYARSKALCEERLQEMHRTRGLPLVIARPGIVLGDGGPLQHWGIGRWHGAGAVRIWGAGRNLLPFVLIDDVAAALVRMADMPEIEGQSFNLVGEPLLSAQGYFAAIRRLTGVQIRVASGNLRLFHVADTVKYLLKRFALRKKGLPKPLLVDWKSRAHLSPFQNDKAKAVLGWQPEADRATFETRAISYLGFFGF